MWIYYFPIIGNPSLCPLGSARSGRAVNPPNSDSIRWIFSNLLRGLCVHSRCRLCNDVWSLLRNWVEGEGNKSLSLSPASVTAWFENYCCYLFIYFHPEVHCSAQSSRKLRSIHYEKGIEERDGADGWVCAGVHDAKQHLLPFVLVMEGLTLQNKSLFIHAYWHPGNILCIINPHSPRTKIRFFFFFCW